MSAGGKQIQSVNRCQDINQWTSNTQSCAYSLDNHNVKELLQAISPYMNLGIYKAQCVAGCSALCVQLQTGSPFPVDSALACSSGPLIGGEAVWQIDSASTGQITTVEGHRLYLGVKVRKLYHYNADNTVLTVIQQVRDFRSHMCDHSEYSNTKYAHCPCVASSTSSGFCLPNTSLKLCSHSI